MDRDRRKEYQNACRQAAMAILLSQSDLETEGSAIAQRYHIESALVRRDLDMLVQNERQKVSGVFKFDSRHPRRSSHDG